MLMLFSVVTCHVKLVIMMNCFVFKIAKDFAIMHQKEQDMLCHVWPKVAKVLKKRLLQAAGKFKDLRYLLPSDSATDDRGM